MPLAGVFYAHRGRALAGVCAVLFVLSPFSVCAGTKLETSADAGDSAEHGIYSISWGNPDEEDVLLTGTDEQKTDVLQAAHPWVRMVGLNALWSRLNPSDPASHPTHALIDPANPAYDWRLVDETIRIAAKYHKPVVIRVVGGLDKHFTPDWVWTKGGFEWIEYLHKTTKVKTVPAVWAPAYQERWGAFVQAFGRRYDVNPQVHRVAITLHAYEMFYIRDQQRLTEAIAKLGFTAAKYKAAFLWNVRTFAKAFPRKALFKDLSEVVDIPADEIDAAVANAKEAAAIKRLDNELEWETIRIVGPRLRLQSDGLHGSGGITGYRERRLDTPTRRLEQVERNDRLKVMLDARRANPIGFETLMPGRNGNFKELVDVGVAWPVRYVGIFTKDLKNPSLAAEIERLGKALQSR
ncbi:MAG: hypothetical protein HY360_04240 [Verrucomicrobia bacterium]|nr:hypothetical protein [Verrucomicrobiota bacterium]